MKLISNPETCTAEPHSDPALGKDWWKILYASGLEEIISLKELRRRFNLCSSDLRDFLTYHQISDRLWNEVLEKVEEVFKVNRTACKIQVDPTSGDGFVCLFIDIPLPSTETSCKKLSRMEDQMRSWLIGNKRHQKLKYVLFSVFRG